MPIPASAQDWHIGLVRYGKVGPQLQADLARIAASNIPVDIVFRQGRQVLGL
jgi:alpha-D-ribose 1-methylphosphonate 5-triphosphate diphosphatase PhnM